MSTYLRSDSLQKLFPVDASRILDREREAAEQALHSASTRAKAWGKRRIKRIDTLHDETFGDPA